MINISIKENMKDRKGEEIGHEVSCEIKGSGDLLATQVSALISLLHEHLPEEIFFTAMEHFFHETLGCGDCEGCDDE